MAPLDNVLAQMKQDQNVLNGWDIVLNMLLDPVDSLFELIYADQAPATWQTVDVTYCQVVPRPGRGGKLVAYTDLQMTLSRPSLHFPPQAPGFAQLTFAADGRLRQAGAPAPDGFDPARDCRADHPGLEWEERPLSSATFVARVPLTVLTGRSDGDASGFRVVLDFPEGSFQFPSLAGGPEPTQLNVQLRGYFAEHSVRYVLNQVATRVHNQLPALTPKSFRLNTLQTNSGKSILQFFITTIGAQPANLTVAVSEPVPDGSQCSVIIRKGIADQLGADSFRDVSLFALRNIAFPGDVVQLDDEYHPYDMLVTGHLDLAPRLAVRDGNHQSVQRSGYDIPGGTAWFDPLSVTVTDVLGKSAAGKPVVFSPGNAPAAMAIQLSPAERTVTVTSDAKGVATLAAMQGKSMRCYFEVGAFQVVASSGAQTAKFDLTVAPTPPPPDLPNARVTIVSGDHQQAARAGFVVPDGTATFGPLRVVVKDPNGIVIPDAEVNWSVGAHPAGMAVQLGASSGGLVTVTGPDGVAVLGSEDGDGDGVHCYYAIGAFQVVASVRGGAQAATFNLTVTPTPPPPEFPNARVAIVSGDGQRVGRTGSKVPGGMAYFGPLAVVVRTPDGRPIRDAQVNWAPGAHPQVMAVQLDPGGTATVTLTGPDGIATLDLVQGRGARCYYAAGDFQVVASVRGGGSATFSMTVTS